MPAFNIRTLLIVAALLSLFSCERVVDLPFDIEPTIEIRSNLSENGLDAQVLMARTATDIEDAKYIDDAVVKVYQGALFLQQLELSSDDKGLPCYKTKNWVPEYGIEYTLKVEVEGFKTVTAKTIVPNPVSIEEPFFKSSTVKDNALELAKVDFDISFSINDPQETSNYYHLSFYQELYDYELDAKGDTVVIDNSLVYAKLNVNEIDESGPPEDYLNSEYLFSDEKFNGMFLRLEFKGYFEFDMAKKIPGDFFMELRTVSSDYYESKKSEQNQPINGDDDVIKGDVFFNNTDNGVGTFAGFTSRKNKFSLQGG